MFAELKPPWFWSSFYFKPLGAPGQWSAVNRSARLFQSWWQTQRIRNAFVSWDWTYTLQQILLTVLFSLISLYLYSLLHVDMQFSFISLLLPLPYLQFLWTLIGKLWTAPIVVVGEEGAGLEGKALDLPVDLRPQPSKNLSETRGQNYLVSIRLLWWRGSWML